MKIKKIMLLASWSFFAISPLKIFAQEQNVHVISLAKPEEEFTDTLIINLKGSDKILFIGDEFHEMVKYKNADSLKILFINDFETAINNKSISKDVLLVHYFVHQSGKRRIKAENPEYTDNRIDPTYEIKRLNLDLPKFQYFIYDLKTGYQIQIYLNNPDDLKQTLNSVNLNEAIVFAGKDKKELKKSYKLEMNAENNDYKITGKTHGQQDAINLSPSLGLGLLGNVFAPIAGGDLILYLTDKYSVGKFKTGISYTVFPFVNSIQNEIQSVNFVNSLDLKFLMNLNIATKESPHWIGFGGGLMKSNSINSYDNAYKFEMLFEDKILNYSFDVIKTHDNVIYGLTIKMPF
jgi:hypothetical protein